MQRAVLLLVHSQTTPAPNMLLYLIWLFNYKPLADCGSSGCWLERSFMSSHWKLRPKPPHVASLAEPRATREIPGLSSRLRPLWALTDAPVLMPPAVVARESLVSGSAIPCANLVSLPRHVFPPHEPETPQSVWSAATSVPNIRSGCVSAGTWLRR